MKHNTSSINPTELPTFGDYRRMLNPPFSKTRATEDVDVEVCVPSEAVDRIEPGVKTATPVERPLAIH